MPRPEKQGLEVRSPQDVWCASHSRGWAADSQGIDGLTNILWLLRLTVMNKKLWIGPCLAVSMCARVFVLVQVSPPDGLEFFA